jgi:hypothetical protein
VPVFSGATPEILCWCGRFAGVNFTEKYTRKPENFQIVVLYTKKNKRNKPDSPYLFIGETRF